MPITALVELSTALNSFPPPLVGFFRALANADLRAMNVSPPPLVGTVRGMAAVLQGDIDTDDGGKFKVFGTTKITGSPATATRVKVTLHDQLSGRVVRSQWTNSATGAYQFNYIRNGAFYLVAFDHTKNYRAVIADQLVPEAM
jgi:hypothetical protein